MEHSNSLLIKLLYEKKILKELTPLGKLEDTNKCLIQSLSERKLISEQQALTMLSDYLQIDIFKEEQIETVDIVATIELIKKINYKKCTEKYYLPVVLKNGAVKLLLTNPLDMDSTNELKFILDEKFKILLVAPKILNSLFCRCDPHDDTVYDELSNADYGAQLEILSNPDEDSSVNVLGIANTPIIGLVNKLILDAIKAKASDIHIEPNQWSYEVRYRIDGTLHTFLEIPKRLQRSVAARVKLLSNMDISEHRKPQDGRMQIRFNAENTDLRVSCIPTSHGECIVLRILQSGKNNLSLEKLNIPKDINAKLIRAISAEGKMLLVTGPTGSGKTTTLYSCLTELIKDHPNIVTVEDPIEYRLAGVNQVQVNELAGVTFANSLRSIMRQDPDVILIGEIRDQETATIAIQAAQTGHMVLSTLHTNDAPSAITRLFDLGVEPFMISSSIAGVVAQRLVRKICPHCVAPLSESKIALYKTNEALAKYKIPYSQTFEGTGCATCRDTGYLGRVGIYSYLEMSPKIAEVIHQGINLNNIIAVAEEEGFIDLDAQAIKMVKAGLTTIDEISPYLVSGTKNVVEKKESKEQYIGILSDSKEVSEKIMQCLDKERILFPTSLDVNCPKLDLDIYIIDDSISGGKRDSFLSILNALNNVPPVILIGSTMSKGTENYSGIIKTLNKGSSPLMIVNKCYQLAKDLNEN